MDVEQFLIRQGWKKGEGLRPGGIKNALLVAHRRDNKGLGFNPQASEGWWERVFDGHLKALDVTKAGGVHFGFDEEQRRRDTSPLYAHFRSGGLLQGTIESAKTKKRSRDAESAAPSAAPSAAAAANGSSSSKTKKRHSRKAAKKRKRDA